MSAFLDESTGELKFFDSVVQETWNRPSMVTSLPIDGRSPVTDHIQPEQLKGTISVLITETPFQSKLTSRKFLSLDGNKRAKWAYKWLDDRRDSTTFIYDSVFFGPTKRLAIKDVSWEVTRKGETVFKIDVVQLSFAYSESVLLPPERVSRPSQQLPIDEGSKAKTDKQKNPVVEKSWAKNLKEWATGTSSLDTAGILSSKALGGS